MAIKCIKNLIEKILKH